MADAGIYLALLPEIARTARDQEWREVDLEALLGWCLDEFPDRPGGMFVTRLRRGFLPPKRYYQPPCPRCGKYSKHEPGCPHRYAMDNGEE